jgi:hypothetical protein
MTLDENRRFGRALVGYYTTRDPRDVWLVFPDGQEANLAQKTFGKAPFTVTSISSIVKAREDLAAPKYMFVLNPGFNIQGD